MYADDTQFLEEIRQWLEENEEVFVAIEPGVARAGYVIVKSFDQFLNLTQSLPGRTRIFVFRDRQLPLRGIADESMRQKALQMINEPEDFLILSMESDDYRQNDCFHGDLHGELKAKFEDFYGKSVAFGKMPPWYDADKSAVSSAGLEVVSVPLRELRIDVQQLKPGKEEVRSDGDDNAGYRTKLGGKPDWIQADDTPICPDCNKRETFICQIDSIDQVLRDNPTETQTYMFGDVGMIYVFFCFECLTTDSVFQCY